jgi:hypothetical protein
MEHGELVLELETLPDSEELAARVQRLRAELLNLDVEHVKPLTAGEAPDGAKGVELRREWSCSCTLEQRIRSSSREPHSRDCN